jgi:hypothetical protein
MRTQYGRLTIIGPAEPHRNWGRQVECACKCGAKIVVILGNLKTGNTCSCGCARSNITIAMKKYWSKSKNKKRHSGIMSQRTTNWWATASEDDKRVKLEQLAKARDVGLPAMKLALAAIPLDEKQRMMKTARAALKVRWATLSESERAAEMSRRVNMGLAKLTSEEKKARDEALAARARIARLARSPQKRTAIRMKNKRALTKFWQSLDAETRAAYIQRMCRHAFARPNKLETSVATYLDVAFPGEWRYNAGDFILAGKVPDFINVNGRKAVLDIFGDYWHRGEDPTKRVAHFA